MIKALLDDGLTKDEIVKIYVDQLGFSPSYAEFIYALEVGEVDGDLLEEETENSSE